MGLGREGGGDEDTAGIGFDMCKRGCDGRKKTAIVKEQLAFKCRDENQRVDLAVVVAGKVL